jgi:hypothetical protein
MTVLSQREQTETCPIYGEFGHFYVCSPEEKGVGV